MSRTARHLKSKSGQSKKQESARRKELLMARYWTVPEVQSEAEFVEKHPGSADATQGRALLGKMPHEQQTATAEKLAALAMDPKPKVQARAHRPLRPVRPRVAKAQLAGVTTYPHGPTDGNDPSLLTWQKDVMATLQRTYEGRLRSVIARDDAKVPRIHFYVTPSPQELANILKQGLVASKAQKGMKSARRVACMKAIALAQSQCIETFGFQVKRANSPAQSFTYHRFNHYYDALDLDDKLATTVAPPVLAPAPDWYPGLVSRKASGGSRSGGSPTASGKLGWEAAMPTDPRMRALRQDNQALRKRELKNLAMVMSEQEMAQHKTEFEHLQFLRIETQRRIAALPDLKTNADATSAIFARHALAALTGGITPSDVNWPAVEAKTIHEAIAIRRQPAVTVKAALFKHSPGCIEKDGKNRVAAEVKTVLARLGTSLGRLLGKRQQPKMSSQAAVVDASTASGQNPSGPI